jgi:hypothetical protein
LSIGFDGTSVPTLKCYNKCYEMSKGKTILLYGKWECTKPPKKRAIVEIKQTYAHNFKKSLILSHCFARDSSEISAFKNNSSANNVIIQMLYCKLKLS